MKGHDFSRADKVNQINLALAPGAGLSAVVCRKTEFPNYSGFLGSSTTIAFGLLTTVLVLEKAERTSKTTVPITPTSNRKAPKRAEGRPKTAGYPVVVISILIENAEI